MLNFYACVLLYVQEFQFVQNEIGIVEFHIADRNYEQELMEKLTIILYDRFNGHIDISLKKVEKLQYSSRGRYKMVVQNIQPENKRFY